MHVFTATMHTLKKRKFYIGTVQWTMTHVFCQMQTLSRRFHRGSSGACFQLSKLCRALVAKPLRKSDVLEKITFLVSSKRELFLITSMCLVLDFSVPCRECFSFFLTHEEGVVRCASRYRSIYTSASAYVFVFIHDIVDFSVHAGNVCFLSYTWGRCGYRSIKQA